ncbi:MAG: hypothetical protein AAGB12_14455, partial [Pseudomonadota bacterium]
EVIFQTFNVLAEGKVSVDKLKTLELKSSNKNIDTDKINNLSDNKKNWQELSVKQLSFMYPDTKDSYFTLSNY